MTSIFNRVLLAGLVIVLLSLPASAISVELGPLKPGTLWVMAGDSITAQRLHTNYIEAFYRTRYPNLNLHFRNSGIGGNRTSDILARFDYDVAPWKPAIVSIELGMNDVKQGDDPAAYIKGMRELIQKIRDIKAEPVLFSSSPVNDGSLPGQWKSDRCHRLDPYTDALESLSTNEATCVFVDQYHPLLEMWGKNRAKEDAAGGTPAPASAAPKSAKGKEAKKPELTGLIPLGGNAVHPGPVGQYTMAATILNGLRVDREVSSATLKADGSVTDAKRCKITDASSKDGKISFTRLDECSPWPIDPKAKAALELMPAIADLSHYMLTVTDLPAGKYAVTIEGKPAATLTEKELAAGWNMSTVFEGALADRSTKIVDLIAKLEGKLNTDWRAASKEKNAAKLEAAQKAIDECEAEVSKACQPVALHFEIEAAK